LRRECREVREHAARLERAGLLEELGLEEYVLAERGRAEHGRPVQPPPDRLARGLDVGERNHALGDGVLGPRAALGWGEAPALGGDRAALHAIRRGHLDA